MKNGNILIVDDKIDLMEPLAEILERKGYNVTMVEDGNKAIGLLKRSNFDILLTPYEMPGVSGVGGFELLKRLYPSMAVIIVNSVNEKKELTDVLGSQIKAVVDKPFNVKKLVETIESILGTPSILIIGYRAEEGEAFKKMLEQRRCRALAAKDGDEAIGMVRENDFDVMLMDAGMAGVDNIELLGRVKKIKPNTEVVMMIDDSSVGLVGDLLKKGAYTCLYKPHLDIEKLVKLIKEVQSQKRIYASSVDSEFSPS
jgi:DNA-binding NtrC family response regulator